MLFAKKLNFGRFKKSNHGIIEFAILIEQAEAANRERILKQCEEQDVDLLKQVLKKVVYFEELIYLDEAVIAEILAATTPKVLAFALWKQPEEFRQVILKQMGMKEKRLMKDEEERMSDATEKTLILGAQKQILKVARHLEEKQKIIFELTNCPRFQARKTKISTAAAPVQEKLAANAGKK